MRSDYLFEDAGTTSFISSLKRSCCETAQIISRISKSGEFIPRRNLLSGTQGLVYLFGSVMVTVRSMLN